MWETHGDRDLASAPQRVSGRATISQMLEDHSPVAHTDLSGNSCQVNSWVTPSPQASCNLQYTDAVYVHHFATQLGRWLDCTDATRQFTLKIPHLVRSEPILLHAMMCFAARHMKQPEVAAWAHEQCVELLISRLSTPNIDTDDTILCAIVILRVYEQLDGEWSAG